MYICSRIKKLKKDLNLISSIFQAATEKIDGEGERGTQVYLVPPYMHLDPVCSSSFSSVLPIFLSLFSLFSMSPFSLVVKTQGERGRKKLLLFSPRFVRYQRLYWGGQVTRGLVAPLCGRVAHLLFQIKADKNVAPLFHELGQISLFKKGPT